HGYRGTVEDLTVENHPLRQFLIPNGYAWAASSYSRNDYDITVGVQDTHDLATMFNGLVAKPDRIYLTGGSMGGHITGVSIEQYPNFYDGALAVCGVMGDFELFDFFLDFSVAAQQMGTGSSTFPVDPTTFTTETVPAIKAGLEAVPGGWPNVLNADGTNFKSLVELRSGGERPNFDEAWFFWNTFPSFLSGPGNFLFDLGATNGTLARSPGNVVDNSDVTYQFDTSPELSNAEQALNDAIVRVSADPQGRSPNGLSPLPPIAGDPSVPILTLHNLGDLFVPFHNEVVYGTEAAANGKQDLVVQRAIRGVSHCDFTGSELVTAFVDLVAWVEQGVKPAGDEVTNPAAVAASDFGCVFTDDPNGDHVLAAPCP
ncbi:MAG TPA: prolyl oligopeptidase family serine peptidase, partial [Acidimicrobiia bacterium]|nr:prolyl oligopeptidase family serine peptidase [Acidimicrobiia bacterium]